LDDLKIEMEDGDEEQGIQGIDGTVREKESHHMHLGCSDCLLSVIIIILPSFPSFIYLFIYSFFFLFLHSFSLLKFCHRSPFNKSKSKSTDHDDIFNSQNTRNTGYVPPLISTGPSKQIHDEKPTGITEGWLEKKKSSKMFSMGPEWQKR
jgi:hypothetical protein